MKNRISERFMKKMSNKANIKKVQDLHKKAINYMEDHIKDLKNIPEDDFGVVQEEIGLSEYICAFLKGFENQFESSRDFKINVYELKYEIEFV